MDVTALVGQIKTDLRISHNKLDLDVQRVVQEGLADLALCGIAINRGGDDCDPLIFNALRLWCRSFYSEDPTRGSQYMERYNALKASLMLAASYEEGDDE